MSVTAKIGIIVKKHFVSGLLVTVPVIVTYFVLRALFNALDGLLNPIIFRLTGHEIPGLGVAATIILILVTGIIMTNFLGAQLYRWGDRFLARTPLIRIIYTGAKQLVDSTLTPSSRAFAEVVLVEYPRRGLYVIGFVAAKTIVRRETTDSDMRVVFIPSTPAPFSGMMVVVPAADVYPIDITVEEAVKALVSGGIVIPDLLRMKGSTHNREVSDATGQSIG
jgi:uncharacterized membrane protein